MKIDIKLSDTSVYNAIRTLRLAKDNLEYGLEQTLELLAKGGAIIAQSHDGSMATVSDVPVSPTESRVIASGGDEMIIAEFGAGDATLNPSSYFPNPPPVPVYPGSYSELVGAGEYAAMGRWEFPPKSGNWMTEVQPKQGLYHAKQWIITNSTIVAKGAIKL